MFIAVARVRSVGSCSKVLFRVLIYRGNWFRSLSKPKQSRSSNSKQSSLRVCNDHCCATTGAQTWATYDTVFYEYIEWVTANALSHIYASKIKPTIALY